MPVNRGFSSEEFRKLWHYAVETDFHAIDADAGDPSHPLATTTILGSGSYSRSFPLARPPGQSWGSCEANHDGSKIAWSSGSEIDVYDTITGSRVVLRGHVDNVGSLGFVPEHPNKLVSSACPSPAKLPGLGSDDPEIIVWDLDDLQQTGDPKGDVSVDILVEEALQAIHSKLSLNGAFELEPTENQEIASNLTNLLGRYQTRRRVPQSSRLTGRLCSSFQSPICNHAGDVLIYLPGRRPKSNGDDTWDIALHSLAGKPEIILSGHRDAIMWVGFSPDDQTVASVSWDGTFRIWEAASGQLRWTFTTDKQNWAGVFSPDSKYFLGTDGGGVARIWDLGRGEVAWTYKGDRPGWRRAIDWSADGRWVVIGGENRGELLMFDMGNLSNGGPLEPAQIRRLSLDQTDLPAEIKRMGGGMLAIRTARFLPASAGLVLVHTTSNDSGIEVVNFSKGSHLRIVPNEADEANQAGDRQQLQVDWVYLERSMEIGIVSADKAHFWSLP